MTDEEDADALRARLARIAADGVVAQDRLDAPDLAGLLAALLRRLDATPLPRRMRLARQDGPTVLLDISGRRVLAAVRDGAPQAEEDLPDLLRTLCAEGGRLQVDVSPLEEAPGAGGVSVARLADDLGMPLYATALRAPEDLRTALGADMAAGHWLDADPQTLEAESAGTPEDVADLMARCDAALGPVALRHGGLLLADDGRDDGWCLLVTLFGERAYAARVAESAIDRLVALSADRT